LIKFDKKTVFSRPEEVLELFNCQTTEWIDGNCYYLDTQGQNEGVLYRNTTTPDGYAVDLEGRWVVNGAVQKQ